MYVNFKTSSNCYCFNHENDYSDVDLNLSEADMQASQTLNNAFKTSFENQTKGKEEIEIEEYKRSLEKMKQLGFKTLKEYFEYLNYMKSKGFNIPL